MKTKIAVGGIVVAVALGAAVSVGLASPATGHAPEEKPITQGVQNPAGWDDLTVGDAVINPPPVVPQSGN